VSQYVLPDEDIEVKVSSFFGKIKEPALASPKITFPESVRITKLYPSPVPDLFKGEQLVLAGRYSGSGDGAIQIEGTVNGELRKFAYDVKFNEAASDHEFIPRLWATRRVGYLLDEIRLRGESAELRDEVVELARKYSIVTPYTAYLIVEDERQRGVAQNARTLRFESDVRLSEAKQEYNLFMRDKSGEKAVASAQSYSRLKAANAPGEAIVAGSADAFRAAPQTAPARRLGTTVPLGAAGGPASKSVVAETAARQYAEQSRFVGGRTFFQNGNQWVDADVQKLKDAKPVRVQFGSPEYFDLLKKHPEAVEWLALGSNVQLVLDGRVYDFY
jgi:Ca-activated chloride channel family protein